MPDKQTVEVSDTKINQAFVNWCELPFVKDAGDYLMFWTYLGENDNSRAMPGPWLLTPQGAQRVDHLLGPYAATMVLAWKQTQ